MYVLGVHHEDRVRAENTAESWKGVKLVDFPPTDAPRHTGWPFILLLEIQACSAYFSFRCSPPDFFIVAATAVFLKALNIFYIPLLATQQWEATRTRNDLPGSPESPRTANSKGMHLKAASTRRERRQSRNQEISANKRGRQWNYCWRRQIEDEDTMSV